MRSRPPRHRGRRTRRPPKLPPPSPRTVRRRHPLQANDPTLTQDERGELYKTLFADIQAEEWSVPICHTKQLWMHTNKVGNVSEDTPFVPVGLGDFRYVTVSK